MGHSIQDYLKKINSDLSSSDIFSLAVTALLLILASLYFLRISRDSLRSIVYQNHDTPREEGQDTLPFGSKRGSTYIYAWCRGSDVIRPENRIFFKSSEAAESAGRHLSKHCSGNK